MTASKSIVTRPIFLAACSAVLIAWALVGFATGHVYVQYGRAPPLHFSDWPAFGICVALAALAMSLVVRIFDDQALALSISNMMLVASLMVALVSLCLRFKLLSVTSPHDTNFAGLFDDATIAQGLDRRPLADFAVASLPDAFKWLKLSCFCLLITAVVCRLLGATKSSIIRHPRTSLVLMIGFAAPFLAWLSLEAVAYVFGKIPSVAKDEPAWRASASYMASLLIVFAAAWFFSALSLLAVALRSFGVAVTWKR